MAAHRLAFFRDQSDLRLSETHVDEKRRGERRSHGVAELVEKQEREHEPGVRRSGSLKEVAERHHGRLVERGGYRGLRHRFADRQRDEQGHHHEGCHDKEHHVPWQMVGKHKPQGARHQPGQSIHLHVHGVAQGQLGFAFEQFPAIGIQGDVLGCGKHAHHAGDRRNRVQRLRGFPDTQTRNA